MEAQCKGGVRVHGVSLLSSPEGDWAERKELEKNARYGMHFTSSTISAPVTVILGTVQKPTSRWEHGAPSSSPNSKTGSASSELRTLKPEKKSERSQSQKH